MLQLIQLSLHYCLSQLIFFIILSSQRVYWCVLDGADWSRQFVKMHFHDKNPAKQKFAATNIYTGGPMTFIMDPKVIDNTSMTCMYISPIFSIWYLLFRYYCASKKKNHEHLDLILTG